MVNSQSAPKVPYRELTVEADGCETAYQKLEEALAEDDRLLSVRRA